MLKEDWDKMKMNERERRRSETESIWQRAKYDLQSGLKESWMPSKRDLFWGGVRCTLPRGG